MNTEDKKLIITRYNRRLNLYGCNIRTLASGTEERRNIRFQVLADIGIKNGSSVLDVGCGFGDFLSFLKNKKIRVKYTGYDINPKLIEIARKKHPSVFFEVKDISSKNGNFPNFDFIVSSSAFNLKLKHEDNYKFAEKILKTCFHHARRGVAVDFMSSYVDFKGKDAFHYSPEKIFSICREITKRVCLRHDYPLFEFCVYLYSDFKSWAAD